MESTRDADGEHDAGDARQGQRRVEQRQYAEDHGDVDRHGDIGEQPENAVGHQHEDDDQSSADAQHDSLPLAIESAPRPRPTVRSSMMVSGAGSAPARIRIARSLALCTVKLPEIWPEPPGDRLADDRRRNHFVVEHDGKRLADVLLGRLREFARTCGIETERDDRLAMVRWSKPGWASVSSPPDTTTRFSIR